MPDACLSLGVLWTQAEISAEDRTPLGFSGDLRKVMLMSAVLSFPSLCLLSSAFFRAFGLMVTLVIDKQQVSVDRKMEVALPLQMAGLVGKPRARHCAF